MGDGLISRIWDDRTARVPIIVIAVLVLLGPLIGVIRIWRSGTFPAFRDMLGGEERRSFKQPFTISGVASADKPEEAVTLAVQYVLATDVPPRIEPANFASVRVYIPKSKWQDIPYPDRPTALRALALTWCTRVNSNLLSTFTIRDIRTGEDLASCHCAQPPN